MDYYAEDISGLPSLSYIALVGPVHDNLSDELHKRIQRIKNASPEKDKLALDVRGITELDLDDFKQLQEILDTLNQIGWELYFCNIPSRLSSFFNAQRVKRQFHVFQKKSDLLAHLRKQKNEPEKNKPVEPIPVIFRTEDGIRLLEGKTINKKEDKLIILTNDHNAKMFRRSPEQSIQLYFNSKKLQMVPQEIQINDLEEEQENKYPYRIEVNLPTISDRDKELLDNYFNVK